MDRQQGQAWGRTTQDKEEKEAPEQAPRDKADSWLHAVAGEDDEVKNMILREETRIFSTPKPDSLGEGSE
jgi:hypothetical protein